MLRPYDPREDGPLYRFRPRRKNNRVVSIPARVAPHVRLVFSEMARQVRSYDDLEAASGIRRASVKAWRHKNRPGLESLEAVLGALGWHFVAVPAHIEHLPPSVAAKLAEVSALAKVEMGEVWTSAVLIAARQLAASEDGPRILAELAADREAALANRSNRRAANSNAPPRRRKSAA
jgi:hypothetical protein